VVNSGREIQVLVGVVKLMTEVVIVIVVATRPPGVTTVQAIFVGKIVPEAVVRRRRRHLTTTGHQAADRRDGAMQAIVAATITEDNNRAGIVPWRLHHRLLVRGREIEVGTTGHGDRRLPIIGIVDRCDRPTRGMVHVGDPCRTVVNCSRRGLHSTTGQEGRRINLRHGDTVNIVPVVTFVDVMDVIRTIMLTSLQLHAKSLVRPERPRLQHSRREHRYLPWGPLAIC